jgi:hypothetical protein
LLGVNHWSPHTNHPSGFRAVRSARLIRQAGLNNLPWLAKLTPFVKLNSEKLENARLGKTPKHTT